MEAIPHENDVLFGRGKAIDKHPGNQRFRSMVNARKPEFRQTRRQKEKQRIVISIIDEVHSLQPPGRFLIRAGDRPREANAERVASNVNPSILEAAWECADHAKAYDKVLQRLRGKEKVASLDSCLDHGQPFQPSATEFDPHNVASGHFSHAKTNFAGGGLTSVEKTIGEAAKRSSSTSISGGACVPLSTAGPLMENTNNSLDSQNTEIHDVSKADRHEYASVHAGQLEPTAGSVDFPKKGGATIPSASYHGWHEYASVHAGRLEPTAGSINFPKKGGATIPSASYQESYLDSESVCVSKTSQNIFGTERDTWVEPAEDRSEVEKDTLVLTDVPDSIERSNIAEGHTPPQMDKVPPSCALDQILGQPLPKFDCDAGANGEDANQPVSNLDSQVNLLLDGFSSQHDAREISLQEWIQRAVRKAYGDTLLSGKPDAEVENYVTMTLPIALKLAESIMAAETSGNPIPLDCISIRNARLKSKSTFSNEGSEGIYEFIELAWFAKGTDDPLTTGSELSRLHAFGAFLYELLFPEGPQYDSGISNSLSMKSMQLNDEVGRQRPQKRQTTFGEDENISKLISRLESRGIPWSLCSLCKNLLECSHGDLCGDEAYSSFADLKLDLELMIDCPSRFLVNIRTNPLPVLEICDELYGRGAEKSKLEQAYQRHVEGEFGGAMISGCAGVGKSKLATTVVQEPHKSKGFFLVAKFDQHKDAKPYSTIGSLFNALCDLFVQHASPAQLKAAGAELESAVGRIVPLTDIVPSISKLIPSCISAERAGDCVNAARAVRYLLCQLLSVISCHSSRPMSLLLDDIQWADSKSLLILGELMYIARNRSKQVFFTFCYRDEKVGEDPAFNAWLHSIVPFKLEEIKLGNLNVSDVNELVSDMLRMSPRITRPLASILHHKTLGSPLYLRELLNFLEGQNLIVFQMSPPRWNWDVERISALKISDDVVALLIMEMQVLSPDLQVALKVTSLMGSSVNYSTLDILSKNLNVDLICLLRQLSREGFTDQVGDKQFSFSHDKIQEAAYDLMTQEQKRKNHMLIGLALCDHASKSDEDGSLFLALDQINRVGPCAEYEPGQKLFIASLNLKGGKILTDPNAALQLFEHGISFLDAEVRWTSQYILNLELHDAAINMACDLDEEETVKRLSDQVMSHAKCTNDKMNCLFATVKSLRAARKFQDAIKISNEILQQLGERPLRPIDHVELSRDIKEMTKSFQAISDKSALSMKETKQKKRDIFLLNLYRELNALAGLTNAKEFADCSLRMAQITMRNGLCSVSPVAFANFSLVLVTKGDASLGYRVGTLAMRLIDKVNAHRFAAYVFVYLGSLVSWIAEPFQSIAERHLTGYNYGQRSGDSVWETMNYQLYLALIYISGQKSLPIIKERCREFILVLLHRKQKFALAPASALYLQVSFFVDGLESEVEEDLRNKIPTWNVMTKVAEGNFRLVMQAHQCTRSFLLKQYDQMHEDVLLQSLTKNNVHARPEFFYGVFFEALISFHFARHHKNGHEYTKMGVAALEYMMSWNEHCRWNFENKSLLLEAEHMYILGEYEKAELLYLRSVASAHDHRFIQEEAIANELAANFFFEIGLHQKSHAFFVDAVKCYEKWGADAIVKRVGCDIQRNFG